MKIILGIVIATLLVIGAVFLLNKNSASQMNMPTPSVMQSTQTKTSPTSQTTANNAVTIQNFAFSPATITVKVGQSITWINKDTAGHSATADDGSFDTGVLSQGQSKTLTFSKVGSFTYHCSVHPNMKGTVIVQ